MRGWSAALVSVRHQSTGAHSMITIACCKQHGSGHAISVRHRRLVWCIVSQCQHECSDIV